MLAILFFSFIVFLYSISFITFLLDFIASLSGLLSLLIEELYLFDLATALYLITQTYMDKLVTLNFNFSAAPSNLAHPLDVDPKVNSSFIFIRSIYFYFY